MNYILGLGLSLGLLVFVCVVVVVAYFISKRRTKLPVRTVPDLAGRERSEISGTTVYDIATGEQGKKIKEYLKDDELGRDIFDIEYLPSGFTFTTASKYLENVHRSQVRRLQTPDGSTVEQIWPFFDKEFEAISPFYVDYKKVLGENERMRKNIREISSENNLLRDRKHQQEKAREDGLLHRESSIAAPKPEGLGIVLSSQNSEVIKKP